MTATALAAIPTATDETVETCETDEMSRETAPDDHLAGKRFGKPFEPGNQLWRRRGKAPGLQTSRRALREAFHKALTPEAMAKCVAKMLKIISSKDAKAAVQAFKVLTECAGVRGDSDSVKAGPSFTFILPGPGAIPDRPAVREGQICKALLAPGTSLEPIDTVAEPAED